MPITRPTITKLAEASDGSSPRAEVGLGAVSQTCRFNVLWAEAELVAKHFLGYSRITDTRLERLLPAPHPDTPALVATKIALVDNHKFTAARRGDMSPGAPQDRTNRLADQSVRAAFKWAKIEVTYERPLYDLLEDADCPAAEEYRRFVSVGKPQPGADVFTQPGHLLKYLRPASGTGSGTANPHRLPLSYNVPRVFPNMLVPLTWRRLPADLFDFWSPGPWLQRIYGDPDATPAVEPYYGTVNKARFGPYPPGTLRFEALEVEQRPAPFVQFDALPSGELVWLSPAVEWDVTFHLRYKPTGHLRLWYGDLPALDAPPRADGGASGLYFVGAGDTYYTPTTVPDDYSLANARPFADLFSVTAI